MTFIKTVLATATTFLFAGSAFAQSTTVQTPRQTAAPLDTSHYNQGSVWIKDKGQAKEYLKSIGVEEKMRMPQPTTPTIYQQNGSVWCKTGEVSTQKGVICADAPKK